MTEKRQATHDASRRDLLKNAVGAVGAVSILALSGTSASAAKVAQSAVGYQDSPKGSQKCSNCRLFEAPNACKSVDGSISPEGWCRIWSKAAA